MPEEHNREAEERRRARQPQEERDGPERAAELPGQDSPALLSGSLLNDARLASRGNSSVRIAMMRDAQRTHGNRAVQRFLQQSATHEGDGRPLAGLQLTPAMLPVQRDNKAGGDAGGEGGGGGGTGAGGAGGGSSQPGQEASAVAANGLIVDDATEKVETKQMKRGHFLSQLRDAVTVTANEALSDLPWGIAARPMVSSVIDEYMARYGGHDAASLERKIRAQVPGAAGAGSAADYINMICARVRNSIADETEKKKEGEKKPDEDEKVIGSNPLQGAASLASGIAGIFFKTRDGSSPNADSPQAVQSRLGPGQPLDGRLRSGLESVFGSDFSGVRVHTDATASQLSEDYNARAFTVGKDIAFGPGEYMPGTPVGDALIAHEVAHVAQQAGARSASPMAKGEESQAPFEEEADTSAVGAVLSMWGGLKGGIANIAQNAMPRLKSGLQLQRCSKNEKKEGLSRASTDEEIGKYVIGKMDQANTDGSATSGIWYAESYAAKYPDRWKPDYWNGYANPEYFTRTDRWTWSLKGRKSASEAIQAWLQGLTIAECASTVIAIQYDALRASVGDEAFDDYFGSADATKVPKHRLNFGFQTPGPIKEFVKLTGAHITDNRGRPGKRPVKVGEWYRFANHPDYTKKHPAGAWSGENVLYVGEENGVQLWSGLGASRVTEAELMAKLAETYNHPRSQDDLEMLRERFGDSLPPKYSPGDDPENYDDQTTVEGIVNAGGGFEVNMPGWKLDVSKFPK